MRNAECGVPNAEWKKLKRRSLRFLIPHQTSSLPCLFHLPWRLCGKISSPPSLVSRTAEFIPAFIHSSLSLSLFIFFHSALRVPHSTFFPIFIFNFFHSAFRVPHSAFLPIFLSISPIPRSEFPIPHFPCPYFMGHAHHPSHQPIPPKKQLISQKLTIYQRLKSNDFIA
jgi:hypothetical protein